MDVLLYVVFICQITLSTSLENLSLSKSATQSSNLYENKWLAEAAVDGNGNQNLSGNSCACTDHFQPTVWWRVNLGDVYAMSNVKIFYTDDGERTYTFRLAGFELYVTLTDNFTLSSPVYIHNNGIQSEPYPPLNFTVPVAVYGQYVTVYKNRHSTCSLSLFNTNWCALFELCEVEVSGCPKKRYGADCQSDCPVNCRYDICAVSDGKCYGCKAGYIGDMCDQHCGAGTYGIGCSQMCSGNCKDGVNCDVTNGACPSGCSDGYTGTSCNETCNQGLYGSSCSITCGSCRNNATCHYVNGSCPNGCGSGVTGPYCKTSCKSGFYGDNCIEKCSGHCRSGVTCDVRRGHCEHGCTAGWKGYKCDTACTNGEYGLNCLNNCTGNCQNKTICNGVDGSCPLGCTSGWKGYLCDLVCERGKYGSGCTETCGICDKTSTCDRQTGVCKQGCSKGYKGSFCRERCNIGYYGENCTLKCIKCNMTCDHVTGECPVTGGRASIDVQDLKLPFIVYAVISLVIILLSVVLVIYLLRENNKLRSVNKNDRNDFEFCLPGKNGVKRDVCDQYLSGSGNIMTKESTSSQNLKTQTYEDLGHINDVRNNYDTLGIDGEFSDPNDGQNKKMFIQIVTKHEESDRNYEDRHVEHAENTYEPLHNVDNSRYANI